MQPGVQLVLAILVFVMATRKRTVSDVVFKSTTTVLQLANSMHAKKVTLSSPNKTPLQPTPVKAV